MSIAAGTLYIVATPIGNLGDFSPRARETLANAAYVAAEDTRVTRKLLAANGINTRLISLHANNESEQSAAVLRQLKKGKDIALVSDAGTPLISDPGFELVRACRRQGITVTPVPGPCALVAALSVAGLPTTRFAFEGFLAVKATARVKQLRALQGETRTLVFYESVHRLGNTLRDMFDVFGGQRQAMVARELTKLHETTMLDSLAGLREKIAGDPNSGKGEAVIIVAPETAATPSTSQLDAILAPLLEELPLKQAVKLAVAITGQSRNRIYARALELAGD